MYFVRIVSDVDVFVEEGELHVLLFCHLDWSLQSPVDLKSSHHKKEQKRNKEREKRKEEEKEKYFCNYM